MFTKNGEYFIIESKYSKTTTPSLNPAKESTGLEKQMSDAWINDDDRLLNVVGEDLAADITDFGYTRVVATHGPDGDSIFKLVDETGTIGDICTP